MVRCSRFCTKDKIVDPNTKRLVPMGIVQGIVLGMDAGYIYMQLVDDKAEAAHVVKLPRMDWEIER